MAVMLLGLLIFLGMHSVRIFADPWRTAAVARIGLWPWKGVYGLVSLLGFWLIVWGYGLARAEPVLLWTPPAAMRHVTALLTLPAFVLLVAPYVPRNAVQAKLRHPMVLGVKLWALAHLLSNGNLADVALFGSFLLWAVLSFRSARQRDRLAATSTTPPAPRSHPLATGLTLLLGFAAYGAFALWGHAAWIGVRPFGA